MITTSWLFLAVRAQTPSGFVWHWRRQSAASTLTSRPFAFYFDCIADARGKGYAGELPAGTRAPLPRLPEEPAAKDAARPVLSITALSANEATSPHTRRRSKVE